MRSEVMLVGSDIMQRAAVTDARRQKKLYCSGFASLLQIDEAYPSTESKNLSSVAQSLRVPVCLKRSTADNPDCSVCLYSLLLTPRTCVLREQWSWIIPEDEQWTDITKDTNLYLKMHIARDGDYTTNVDPMTSYRNPTPELEADNRCPVDCSDHSAILGGQRKSPTTTEPIHVKDIAQIFRALAFQVDFYVRALFLWNISSTSINNYSPPSHDPATVINCVAEGSYNQGTVSLSSQSETGAPKRRHQTAFPEAVNPNNSTGGDSRSPAVRPKIQETDESVNLRLACPYFKKDIHTYHACIGYQMKRIKDVKQHIFRKHSYPDFYCESCDASFSTANDFQGHQQFCCSYMTEANSSVKPISGFQKIKLMMYTSGRKPMQQQWHDMWDIIFPDEPKPKSIYVGSYLEEVMPVLRVFWNDKQSDIISRVAQNQNSEGLDDQTVRTIMRSLFDRFEEEMASTSPTPATNMQHRQPHVPCAILPATSSTRSSSPGFVESTSFLPAIPTMVGSELVHHDSALSMDDNSRWQAFTSPNFDFEFGIPLDGGDGSMGIRSNHDLNWTLEWD